MVASGSETRDHAEILWERLDVVGLGEVVYARVAEDRSVGIVLEAVVQHAASDMISMMGKRVVKTTRTEPSSWICRRSFGSMSKQPAVGYPYHRDSLQRPRCQCRIA